MLDAHRTSHRSVLLALLLGLGSAVACIDEEVLEDADCLDDKDCFNSQECVITPYQMTTVSGEGWCRPKGDGCLVGEQPGCACKAEVSSYTCTGSVDNIMVVPSSENDQCICVFPEVADTSST